MWPAPGMMNERDPDVEGCSVLVLRGAKPGMARLIGEHTGQTP
jgi:hypothetical protein